MNNLVNGKKLKKKKKKPSSELYSVPPAQSNTPNLTPEYFSGSFRSPDPGSNTFFESGVNTNSNPGFIKTYSENGVIISPISGPDTYSVSGVNPVSGFSSSPTTFSSSSGIFLFLNPSIHNIKIQN